MIHKIWVMWKRYVEGFFANIYIIEYFLFLIMFYLPGE